MKVGRFTRRTAAQFVLLTWAGALAWLARRELGKPEAQSIAEATLRLNPEAHFFAVKAGPYQIGYASVTVDTMVTGFRLSEVLALDVPEADSIRRVTRRTELTLSRSLRLRSFDRTVTGGGLFEEFSGIVVGDSILTLGKRDARDREPVQWSVPLPGEIVLPQVLPYRLAFGKRLEVGRSVDANVFDMNTGIISRVTFAATAESTFVVADSAVERGSGQRHRWTAVTFDTVKAFRIEHQATGTPVVTWVDEHGGLVRAEAALGVRLERSAFELVSFNYRQAIETAGPEPHRLVPAMKTVVDAGIVPDRDTVSSYRIVSEPVERFLMPRTAWLVGGRQAVSDDDQLTVGGIKTSASARPRSEYLDPASAVAPVEAELVALARKIVGNRTGRDRIDGLVHWVATTIRADRNESAAILPIHVVRSQAAGAEGHAELLVALARSMDLEARVVSGVLIQRGRVYGHTWAEIDHNGSWLAVDPTFNQIPASSRLVRATVGTGGRPIDLVPLLGSAKFEPIVSGTR